MIRIAGHRERLLLLNSISTAAPEYSGIDCKRLYLAHEFDSGPWKILLEESFIK
jgi:hypothetical protein